MDLGQGMNGGNMDYRTTDVAGLADTLKTNQTFHIDTAILVGAGVSASAGIPTAAEIIEDIRCTYPHRFQSQPVLPSTYAQHMAMLQPGERIQLIRRYIAEAKVNLAHLYLGSLTKRRYFDRILTTNFDPLANRALILQNVFPAVYDFAAIQTFVPGRAAELSIFYLHGQHDGFLLLNTDEEMRSLSNKIESLFADSNRNRTWIVIGYSGENDPVFQQLASMKSYDYGLYWVGYEDNEPADHVRREILSPPLKGGHFIRGYNADSFFIKLAQELGVGEPQIVDKPLSYLKEVLDNISEFTKDNKRTGLTDKALRDIDRAREDIELNQERDLVTLIQEARKIWVFEKFDQIDAVYDRVLASNSVDAKEYLANALSNWRLRLRERSANEPPSKRQTELWEQEQALRRGVPPSTEPRQFLPHERELITSESIRTNALSEAGRADASEILGVPPHELDLVVKKVYKEDLLRSYLHRIYVSKAYFDRIRDQFEAEPTLNIIKAILDSDGLSLFYKKTHQFIPTTVGDDQRILHVPRNKPCVLHVQVSYVQRGKQLEPIELLISKYLEPVNVCGFLTDSGTHAATKFSKLAEDYLANEAYRHLVTDNNAKFFLPFPHINAVAKDLSWSEAESCDANAGSAEIR